MSDQVTQVNWDKKNRDRSKTTRKYAAVDGFKNCCKPIEECWMNFELSEEQKMLRDMARKFAEQEMMPALQESKLNAG